MLFRYWTEGLIFIGLFFLIIGSACFASAWLGSRLIKELGIYPSRSAQIQMSIFGQTIVMMVLSFFFLSVFFKYFSD